MHALYMHASGRSAEVVRYTGDHTQLVVEVMSPSNNAPDHRDLIVDRAERFGIEYVCFVDPDRKTVDWPNGSPDWLVDVDLARALWS